MPFIIRPTLSSYGDIGTQPVTPRSMWEWLLQALARAWAFILGVLSSFVTWFEGTHLGDKLIQYCSAVDHFTQAHPLLTGLPLALYYGPNLIRVLIAIPWFTFSILANCLGCGRNGVERDSFAAHYESQYYTYGMGGIPEDSLFAHMQSAGARAPTWRTSFIMFVWYAVDLALGVWGFYILGRYWGVVN